MFEYCSDPINTKGGCNFFATKRFNKTARHTLRSTPNIALFQGWLLPLLLMILIQMVYRIDGAPLARSPNYSRNIQKELIFEELWKHPCGGQYTEHHKMSKNESRHILKNIIITLQRQINLNLVSFKPDAINVGDINEWFRHNDTYAFLPRINTSRSLQLKTWHKYAQIFVGSLNYMFYKQYHYENLLNRNVTKSNQLKELAEDAKKLLCEIETVMNKTNRGLPGYFTASDMMSHLNYGTKLNDFEVKELDLKFTVVRYKEFLNDMKDEIERWQKSHTKAHRRGIRERSRRRHSGVGKSKAKRKQRLQSSLERDTSDISDSRGLTFTNSEARNRNQKRKNRNRRNRRVNKLQ